MHLIKGFYAFIFLGLLLLCSSCAETAKLYPVLDTHVAMGTIWNIKVYSKDTSIAKSHLIEGWEYLDFMDSLWSNYRVNSQINILAQNSNKNIWTDLHPSTIDLITKSEEVKLASLGCFNVFIGPLSRYWNRAFKTKKLPLQENIANAISIVNYANLLYNKEGQAMLGSTESTLDLGGIAKGYAVDMLFHRLSDLGYKTILIDGGGDIRAGLAPPGKEGWKIKAGNKQFLIVNKSIATSGSTYRFIEVDGKVLQHHINPKSGQAVDHNKTITVITEECWKADAYSTALSVCPDLDLSAENLEIYEY